MVVFLHEMAGSMASWDGVWRALPQDIGLLRYDLRGAGQSEKPPHSQSIDTHVADLHALMMGLDLHGPVILVGNAVGGAIALAYAACHPGHVVRVIALAPACGVATERKAAVKAQAGVVRAQGMREAFMPLIDAAWPPAHRGDGALFAPYRRHLLGVDPANAAETLEMLADADLDAILATICLPVMLVGGEYDQLRPAAEIERLAALIPAAQICSANTGHYIQIERPDLVADLILDANRDAEPANQLDDAQQSRARVE